MSFFAGPLRSSYRYLQRQAHENTVIFYSCIIGAIGPIMVVTIPPLREKMGWRPSEMVPTTYPLPKRARQPIQGYEDE